MQRCEDRGSVAPVGAEPDTPLLRWWPGLTAFCSPVLPAQCPGEAVPPTHLNPKATAFSPEREALIRFSSWVPRSWVHRAIPQAPGTRACCVPHSRRLQGSRRWSLPPKAGWGGSLLALKCTNLKQHRKQSNCRVSSCLKKFSKVGHVKPQPR